MGPSRRAPGTAAATLGVPPTATAAPIKHSPAPTQPPASPPTAPPSPDRYSPTTDELACLTAAGHSWPEAADSGTIGNEVLDCLSDESVVQLMFMDAGVDTPGIEPDTGFAADLRRLNDQDEGNNGDITTAFMVFISLGVHATLCLSPEELASRGLDDSVLPHFQCMSDLGITADNPEALLELLAQCTEPTTTPEITPLPPHPPMLTPSDSTPERSARIAAASHLGAPPESLTLTHWQPNTWSNGCRGCTQPDSVCTQALVEGFIAVYEHQETGRSVRVDADADGAPAPCPGFQHPAANPLQSPVLTPYSGLTPHYEKRNNITETAPVPEHPASRHQASGQTTGRPRRPHRCNAAEFLED